MYFILAKNGTKAFYLLQNREYIVGRKECDILIKDDTSISRKHALLIVKNGKVYIKDLGAKYKTFLNNVEVNASVVTEVNVNDEIKFGILSSIYILKEQKLNITTSGLTLEEKKMLSKVIEKVEGKLSDQWSKKCSHLTVREIMLTLKVLCALIERQPIVNQDYWTEFLENVNRNLPPPDPNSYKPTFAESVLSKNINFSDEHSRKTLFSNKIFVFKDNSSKAKVETIIELAGGKCICWDEKKITSANFLSSNPQYILIQDDSKNLNTSTSFMEMISYLHNIRKRSIPFQEIAMAIVSASCEKDCNPDFDRAGMLIKGREEIIFTSKFLAPGTQTQDYENEVKPSLIIPETVKEQLSTPIECSQNKQDAGAVRNKREGQLLNNEEKRIKLKKTDEKETYSSIFPDDSVKRKNIVTSTQKEVDSVEINVPPTVLFNDPSEISYISNENADEKNLKRTRQELCNGNKRIKLDDKNFKPLPQNASEEWISVDLTVEDKEIPSNLMPSTSKHRSSIEKSENPFAKFSTKSKSTKITEFFKQSPLSSPNSTDLSVIQLDSLANGKRKTRDVSPAISKNEQAFIMNPFSVKKFKTQESSTDNPLPKPFIIESVPKDNRLILSSKNNEKPKKGKATSNEKTEKDSLTPYMFNVTIVDKTIENNHQWLSKTSTVKDETDVSKEITHFDENMQNFLESFNNCVIVETKSLIRERVTVFNEHNGVIDGKKNFKKFKKIQPLHVQTTIVPKARYRCTTNSEVTAY